MIFQEEPPYMSRTEMEAISKIIDWFVARDGTFLRVFDRDKSAHVFPRYATDELFMQEVSYHIFARLLEKLHRKKKELFLGLPLWIGLYEIRNHKHAEAKMK